MPKPPILPPLDWKAIFESGLTFDRWLQVGESESNRRLIDKTKNEFNLDAATAAVLKVLDRDIHVVAIAEDWCPDVIRHVPVLQKMAEATPHLKVRFIAREDAPEVFARFLTFGGEAIPKFIFLSDQFTEFGDWGAMPEGCKLLMARGKATGDVTAARKLIYEAYRADPDCIEPQEELRRIIECAIEPRD